MTTIYRNVTAASVDCGTGNSADDTCYITCQNSGDGGLIANCGDAGTCYIHCDEEKCLRDSTINATLSNSLEILATGNECLKSANIYLPTNGNASIIVDTQGASSIIKQAFIHSQNTDYIHIECNDPLRDDTSQDECKELVILAADATYLSVSINGATYSNNKGLIQCPFSSILEPSCVINATNSGDMSDLIIDAGNGTTPKDVLFYGGIGNYYANIKMKCQMNQVEITYDKNLGTFNGTGDCWRDLVVPEFTEPPTTMTPTTATPTTNNPTTAIPTTANPTTANPTTATPTTNNPTTAVPTTSNPTNIPTTSNPTFTHSPSTTIPTTNNPTTAFPTTNIPTAVGEVTDAEFQTTVLYAQNGKGGGFKTMTQDPMMMAIMGVGILGLCAILICLFVLFRKYKQRNKSVIEEINMTENTLYFGGKQLQNKNVEGDGLQYEGDITTNENALGAFQPPPQIPLTNNNVNGVNSTQTAGNVMPNLPPVPAAPETPIGIMTNNNQLNVKRHLESPDSPLTATEHEQMDMSPIGFETPVGVVDTLSMMIQGHQNETAGNNLEIVNEENMQQQGNGNDDNDDEYEYYDDDDEQVIEDMVLETPGNISVMPSQPAGPVPPPQIMTNNDNVVMDMNDIVNDEEVENSDSYDMFTPLPDGGGNDDEDIDL